MFIWQPMVIKNNGGVGLMNIWEILALVYFVLPFVLMYISSKI